MTSLNNTLNPARSSSAIIAIGCIIFVSAALMMYGVGELVSLKWQEISQTLEIARGFDARPKPRVISGWEAVQFLISYQEHGFVKRGLVGSVFRLFQIPPSLNHIIIFSVSMCILLASLLTYMAIRFQAYFGRKEIVSLAAILLASPAMFSHFGYDGGRYDFILLIFFLFSLIALTSSNYWLAGLLSFAALLTHENYLFVFMPILTCVVLGASNQKIRSLATFLVLPLTSVLAIFLFGAYEPGKEALIVSINQLSEPLDYALRTWDVQDIAEIWTSGVAGSMGKIKAEVWTLYEIKRALPGFIPIALMLCSYINYYRRQKTSLSLLTLCPLAPCLLFFVGVDYYRWVAFIWMSLFSVLIIEKIRSDGTAPVFTKPEVLMHCSLLLLGPLGVNDSLPWIFILRETLF